MDCSRNRMRFGGRLNLDLSCLSCLYYLPAAKLAGLMITTRNLTYLFCVKAASKSLTIWDMNIMKAPAFCYFGG